MAYCEAVDSANLLSNGEDVQQSLRGVLAHTVPRVDEGAASHTACSLQERDKTAATWTSILRYSALLVAECEVDYPIPAETTPTEVGGGR